MSDTKYTDLIAKGVEQVAEEKNCKIERGRAWFLSIDLDNGTTAHLTWGDVCRVADICDCEIYAEAVAYRLGEGPVERWDGEHYRTLRRGLDERGEEYAARIAKSVSSARDEIIEMREDIDLTDEFAERAAYEA